MIVMLHLLLRWRGLRPPQEGWGAFGPSEGGKGLRPLRVGRGLQHLRGGAPSAPPSHLLYDVPDVMTHTLM